jgi:small-conductance mechanosensitive channel
MKSDYKFAIKTGFRIVIMITILFSLFILAAGSMRYWEAWVYCILLFLMMFSSFVYFLKKDIAFLKSRVLKRKEEDKTQKSLQNIFSILFVIGFIIPGLDYRFNLSNVPFYLNFNS